MVTRVLDFLDVVVDQQAIRNAIANNSVQKMQEKEQRTPQLSNAAPRANGPEESRFIRSGSVGGWRNRLTESQVELIEDHAGEILARMGYPVGPRAVVTQAGIQTTVIAGADQSLVQQSLVQQNLVQQNLDQPSVDQSVEQQVSR